MKTLNEICKSDVEYVKVIQEMSVVKNAVELLGGRRRKEMRTSAKDEGEGGEGEERKGKKEEREGIVWCELRVKEKIGLLELLSGLVKRGVELGDEEELKEVGMKLEEEGNEHVEGEGDEEEEDKECKDEKGKYTDKDEEKREWEELSERAHHFVWVMEKMKARRDGKKSQTIRMVKRLEEKEGKLEEANGRLEAENAALKAELGKSGKEGGEGKGGEKKTEIYRVNKTSEIKLLGEMRVLFGDWSMMRMENNSIVHNYKPEYASAYLGDKLDRSVHRMFESLMILSC